MNQIPKDSMFCNDHGAGGNCPCFDPFGTCQLYDEHLESAGGDQVNYLRKKCLACKAENPVIKSS